MNATDLPSVTICGNPACGGWQACDSVPAEPLFGITDWLARDADLAVAVRHFVSELAMDIATDSAGVAHVVPAANFVVHKGGTDGRPEWAPADSVAWTCVYAGPCASRDEALEGVPLWTEELSHERVLAAAAAA